MLPDLQHLIHLQDLDLNADRIRRRIEDIPRAQQALESRLDAARAALDDVKTRSATNQTARRENEKELAAVQGRLSKYKDQLMAVKTNKEYQAMQHEIAAAEAAVRGIEDKELERMEEAEKLAAEQKAAQAALEKEQTDVAREQQLLDAERRQLGGELERLTADRAGVVSRLSKETLALFDRIAHGRKGIAVAEARDGLCTVCHVRLRPQVFNEVRRNETIVQCDSCTRILYYVPAPAQGAAPQPS
jgi:uncharacterized protein